MNKKLFLAIAVAALFSASCSSRYDFVQKPLDADNPEKGMLTLGEGGNSLALSHIGGAYDGLVVFTADEPWGISGLPSWLQVVEEDAAGLEFGHAGTSKLRLSVRPNLSGDEREANLVFTGGGKQLSSLHVTQPQVVFALKEKDPQISFDWTEFQLTDPEKGTPAKEQPYSRSLGLESNVDWAFAYQEQSDTLFHASSDKLQGDVAIELVPLKPGLRRSDVSGTILLVPVFGVALTSEEQAEVARNWTPEISVGQSHLLFDAFWTSGEPVFSELGSSLSGQTAQLSVVCEEKDKWRMVDSPDWLTLTGASGELEKGASQDGGSGDIIVSVSADNANPGLQPRPFNISFAPVLPDEVLAAMPDEVLEQLVVTVSGSQKGFTFEVTGNTLEDGILGYDFANEDVDRVQNPQKYSVQVKIPGNFEDVCQLPAQDSFPWIAADVRKTAGADSTYTLTFTLREQNLDLRNALRTPSAGNSYQNTGYAYFGATESGTAPYSVVLRKELFAQSVNAPAGVPFEFSQAKFDFEVTPRDIFSSLGPRFTRSQEIQLVCSGPWEAKIEYGEDNDDPSRLDWFEESEGVMKGEKATGGALPLNFRAKDINPYEHTRSARLVFSSLNHTDGSATIELPVRQNEYKFIIREAREESTAAVSDFGTITAYQGDEEPLKVFIECGGAWTMTECPSFLTPSRRESTDEEGFQDFVYFDIKTNTDTVSDREGLIAIEADNGARKEIAVRQSRFVFEPVKTFEGVLPAYSDSELALATLTVTKGAKWRVIQGSKEIVAPRAASGNEETLSFRPVFNPDEKSRSVTYNVEITEPKGVAYKTLVFDQNPFEFTVGATEKAFKELDTRETSLQQIAVKCSGPWEVVGESDGLHCEKVSPEALSVWADRNLASSARQNYYYLVSTAHQEAGISKQVQLTLTQEPFIWAVSNTQSSGKFNYSLEAVTNVEIPLSVKSSAGWKVKLLRDNAQKEEVPLEEHVDIIQAPESYGGDESGKAFIIRFKPQDNLEAGGNKKLILRILSEFADESAASGAAGRYMDVKLDQKPFNWVADFAGSWEETDGRHTYEWEANETGGKYFYITSAGDWYIRNDDTGAEIKSGAVVYGWKFEWSAPSRNRETRITVTPTVNPNRVERHVNFTVVSKVHEAAGRSDCHESMTASQKPYEFHFVVGGQAVNETSITRAPLNTDRNSINLACSGTWQVDNPASSWIEDVSRSANTLSFKLKANTGLSNHGERNAVLTLTANNGLTIKLTVIQQAYVFEATPSAIHIKPEGGESKPVSVTISPSGKYSARRTASWVLLNGRQQEISQLRGGDELLVSALADDSGSDQGRSAQVVLESVDIPGLVQTITVNQTPYILRFGDAVQQEYHVSPDSGTSLDLPIESTVSWVMTAPEWIRLSTAGGTVPDDVEEARQFPVTASVSSANTGRTRRWGNILLAPQSDQSRTADAVAVYQDAFLVEGTLAAFSAVDAQPQTLSVFSSNEWELDRAVCPDWLDFNAMGTLSGNGSESGESVTVAVQDNTGGQPRTGKLVFVNKAYEGVKREITVTQNAFQWTVTQSGTWDFPALPGNPDRLVLTVATSGEFETVIEPADALSWLVLENGSGTDRGIVTVRPAGDNLSKEAFAAKVTVRHKKYPEKSQSYDVRQDGYVFSITSVGAPVEKDQSFFFSPDGTTNREFTVTSTGAWHLEGVPSWISVTGNSTLRALENTSGARREAVVTFVCDRNSDYNITVTLVQDVFQVDGSLQPFAELSATSQQLSVYASGSWSASSSDGNVTVTPSSGTGNATLTVFAADNVSTTPRSGSIVVSYVPEGYSAAMTKTVPFSQNAYRWNSDPVSLSFAPAGSGPQSVEVVSSGAWSVTDKTGDWYTLSAESGTGGSTIVVTPADNAGEASRSASFTIRCSDNPALVKRVTVAQEALTLSSSLTSLGFAAIDSGSATLQVSVSHGGWSITGVPSWLSVTPQSGESGATVTVVPTGDNMTDAPYEAIITLVSTILPSRSVNISVTQDNYVFDATKVVMQFNSTIGLSQTLQVVCSGDWSASGVPDWIDLDPASGTGNASVVVHVKPNYDTQMRSASFYISSRNFPTLQREIVISQLPLVYNQPEVVDLGLSVKWASFNLGATAPEDPGALFAWGETQPKDSFTWDNYKWGTGYESLTKYNSLETHGHVDNLYTLLPEDDAARAKLGGNWRMPTNEEQRDLRNKCNWTAATVNGVRGYWVQSRTNTNRIFLPVTGLIRNSELLEDNLGKYWSSSLDDNAQNPNPAMAKYMGLNPDNSAATHVDYGSVRYSGLAIRAVCE